MHPMEQMSPQQLFEAILKNRQIDPKELEEYLNPDYELHLHDPYLFLDMQKAVNRIVMALESSETVAVYGDYDIDGLAATTLLSEYLELIGLSVIPYIPDRFEEGYGLNLKAITNLQKQGVTLIVTVDCGITGAREISEAKAIGVDVIVTDHHLPASVLPDMAVAVINPKLRSEKYPFSELCGTGVAFKLVQALQLHLGIPSMGQEKWYLDLVALGTICDSVPLLGENRVMVRYGLIVLAKTKRPGLLALLKISGIKDNTIGPYHVGFVLGPRLNAAGRLENAKASLELLMAKDYSQAQEGALKLEQLNQKRRIDQDKILVSADAQAEQRSKDSVLVLWNENWSHGIIGIVASKLVEKWQRPVMLFQVMGDEAKGSARSTKAFDIGSALAESGELLLKHGGHFYAAGATVLAKHLDKLRKSLNQYYAKHVSDQLEAGADEIKADVELVELSMVNDELVVLLAQLEPFGQGNPKPILMLSQAVIDQPKPVGDKAKHLKLKVRDKNEKLYDAIAFGMGGDKITHGQRANIYFEPASNNFNGMSSIQLVLRRIEPID